MRYRNRRYFSALSGAVLAVGVLMAPSSGQAQQGGMQFIDRNDGGVEIKFRNGCHIAYNRQAKRGGHAGHCSDRQYASADEAAVSYLRASSSANAVPEGQMQRYCQGEASGRLNTRPTNISTLPVERSGGGYIVYGQTPPSGSNVTTFECTFDRRGVFNNVVVTGRANKHSSGSGNNKIPRAAEDRCVDMFGGSVKVTQVSALRPGYWEVIMQSNSGPRMVACTISSGGEIENWVEMN